MNSFSNAIVINVSTPNLDNKKEHINDIITFAKYFKETLEKNEYSLCSDMVFEELIAKLNSLDLEDNKPIYDDYEIISLMDNLFHASIRELLIYGSVASNMNRHYNMISVVFYKTSEGEIQSITQF